MPARVKIRRIDMRNPRIQRGMNRSNALFSVGIRIGHTAAAKPESGSCYTVS
ncbi:hypothetical protein D3C75_1308710 [compost metagenome]